MAIRLQKKFVLSHDAVNALLIDAWLSRLCKCPVEHRRDAAISVCGTRSRDRKDLGKEPKIIGLLHCARHLWFFFLQLFNEV